jgi:16S rRNA (cytosine967-C5)-methyltransferase
LTRAEREALAQPAQAVLPAFLQAQLEATFGQDAAIETQALLSTRALLDIRINTLRADIDHIQQVLTEAGVVAAKTPLSALGLRLEGAPDLAPLNTFKAGAFEVQDEGSQLCALIAGSERPALVIDYCAGGGGKTLALACTQSEQDEGKRIIACDINGERLKSIGPRLARAGVTAELRKLGLKGEGVYDLQGQADLVLVDAPCSGSGVWRRRPEQAWRLTQAGVDHFAKTQGAVLQHASKLVKPGGRLAYVTCSVLHAENGAVADAFLAKHANTYRPIGIAGALNADWITAEGRARLAALAEGGHTLQLSPGRTGTDGFFIALFERIS